MIDHFWLAPYNTGPMLTDHAITAWEEYNGFTLPKSLTDRWRRLNGGNPRFSAYPEWPSSERPFRISSLLPIMDKPWQGCFPIATQFELNVTEVVCIGDEEDDFYLLGLDYRSCGRFGEPAVCSVSSNNDGSCGLKGDDAIDVLAPSFDDFVSGCIRRDLADFWGIAAPHVALDRLWADICECLDLVDINNAADKPGGICGRHKLWTSFPCATNGVGPAWFDIVPNDNGGQVEFPNDLDYNWVISTDAHPRFRGAVLQALYHKFPNAVKPLHFVDWRAWRSELSEALDDYFEQVQFLKEARGSIDDAIKRLLGPALARRCARRSVCSH